MQISNIYNKPNFTNNASVGNNDRRTALKYDLKNSAIEMAVMSGLLVGSNMVLRQNEPFKVLFKDGLKNGVLCGALFSLLYSITKDYSGYGKKIKEKYDSLNLTAEDRIKNIGILTCINLAAVSGVELLSQSFKDAVKNLKLSIPMIAGIGTLGILWNACKTKKFEQENHEIIQ